jgi:hypothetical protein
MLDRFFLLSITIKRQTLLFSSYSGGSDDKKERFAFLIYMVFGSGILNQCLHTYKSRKNTEKLHKLYCNNSCTVLRLTTGTCMAGELKQYDVQGHLWLRSSIDSLSVVIKTMLIECKRIRRI